MDIKNSVFFVCYGGGHFAAVKPVAKRLVERKEQVLVLALTTAMRPMAATGIPTVGMRRLISEVPGYRRASQIGAVLARHQSLHPAVSIEESSAYLGIGFHSLVKKFGLAEAKKKYSSFGRQVFLPTDFFIKLFKKKRPKLVVATNSPRSERAALEAARELRIPSVCIVDLYAKFEMEWCASEGYASKICVINEQVRERFEKAGVSSSRLSVTGNPAFDRLASVDRMQRRTLLRHTLKVDNTCFIVVWISQPEPRRHPFSGVPGDESYSKRVEKHLFEAFKNDPNVYLIMRLHPSESRPPEVFGERVRYSYLSEALDDLLCIADCVVTAGSTVGLEAAYLGLPVIQCMDSIFSQDLPLAELGVATAVETYRELKEVIRKILASSSVRQHARAFNDDATNRVESVILQLLGSNGTVV